MDIKKAYAYLFLFFLIFSLFPLHIVPSIADPSAVNVNVESATLIRNASDYALLPIDHTKIVDKRVYTPQVLCEGHIPFILNFEADDNITLNKGQIGKLLTHEIIDIKGNRNAEISYWILINETYMRTEKIFELQSYEYNYPYFNNDTQLWENETRIGWTEVLAGYQDVEDYHYVWIETKNLQGHYFKNLDFVVLDVMGKFTASLDDLGIDVAPTVELLDYKNTFSEWAWWNANWDYYRKITIASSYIDNTLTDFPLLVVIDNTSIHVDNNKSIRFVGTDNSTEFYYEIEFWDDTGNCYVWVNISEGITSGSDYEFLMYYNNTAATDNQNPANVWHSKYIMVQHMNDSTTSTTLDSTSNNNDGTKTGANTPLENASGKIGVCQEFNGSWQINCTDIDAVDGATTLTMSGWYYANDLTAGKYNAVMNKIHDSTHTVGFHLYVDTTTTMLLCGDGSSGLGQVASRAECSVGNWYFFTYVYNGGGAADGHKLHYYSNGTNVSLSYSNTLPSALPSNNNGFLIGEDPKQSAGVYPFNGSIDEARIMSVNANASWIKADFHTQNQTSGFLTWGSEQEEPLSPTNFIASALTAHLINLTWTKGSRTNYTRIQNKTGSYPENVSDGTLVYNGTLTSYNHTGLTNDTVYYYRAWGYNETNNEWSTGSINATNYTVVDPTVTTNTSTGIKKTNVTMRGFLSDYGGENCLVWFEYGTLVSYGNKTTNQTMDNRSAFNDDVTGLSSGVNYHYRAAANNTRSTTYGSDITFVTKPSAPTSINVSHYNATAFDITWTKATGANRTIVRRYNGSTYPSLTTGILVCNISGSQVYDNNTATNTEYRYTLWSWSKNGNNLYSAPTNVTWGVTTFYVYNESDGIAIPSWDIFISNDAGSSTYNKTGNTNPLSLNASALPVGDPIFIEFTASNFKTRYYYYLLADINNRWYNLSAYLPPEGEDVVKTTSVSISNPGVSAVLTLECTPDRISLVQGYNESLYGHWFEIPEDKYSLSGNVVTVNNSVLDANTSLVKVTYYCTWGTYATLYSIIVIDEYDQGIGGVYVKFRKFISIAEEYKDVCSLYTDAVGQISIYLQPGVQYKVNMSKTGYNTTEEDYITDPDYYGLGYPKYFRILATDEEIETITFSDICRFTGEWITTNNTLKIYFYDSYSEVSDVTFNIYESYNNTLTWKERHIYGAVYNITFYNSSTLNTSRMHKIVLEMNHTTLGHVTNQTIFVTPLHTPGHDEDWIEDKFVAVGGPFDLGYVKFFILFLPAAIVLIGAGAIHHPGAGIFGAGLYLTFVSWNLKTDIQVTITVLVGLFILLGIITIIGMKGKGLIKKGG